MCGRARCSLAPAEVCAACGLPPEQWTAPEAFHPSYNVAPGASVPVLSHDKEGARRIHTMKWGLVPSFTKPDEKPDHFRMFNARHETLLEKGIFKRLVPRQRCVVPLNGFYEWKQEGKAKQPYYIHFQDERPMKMAGLFDAWRRGEGEEALYTFTILTTESSERLQWLHNRMPVLLHSREAEETWLESKEIDESLLCKLSTPYNSEDLTWHPVSPAMSRFSCQGPQCSAPIKKPSIKAFFKAKAEKEEGESKPASPEEARDVSDAPAVAEHIHTESKQHARQLSETSVSAGEKAMDNGSHALTTDAALDEVSKQRQGQLEPAAGSKKRDLPHASASPKSGKQPKVKLEAGQGSLDSFFIKNPK